MACFDDFLGKNQLLPIFYTQNDHFSIMVTLWRHSDVIHYRLIPMLVSMEKGCPTYTLVVNYGYMTFSIDNSGACNIPLRKICLENPSGEQGLKY